MNKYISMCLHSLVATLFMCFIYYPQWPVTKREGSIYHQTPLQHNKPSFLSILWGPATFRDLWSTLPQILHNVQPECTLNLSHTLISHHVRTHNSDHSRRACVSFIKKCTETCYSSLRTNLFTESNNPPKIDLSE